jgi:hypothetical protein
MTGERASKEEIKEAAARPDVVFLDVRTEPEIAENPLTSRPFVAVECNVTDSSILEAKIDTVLTDKDGEQYFHQVTSHIYHHLCNYT